MVGVSHRRAGVAEREKLCVEAPVVEGIYGELLKVEGMAEVAVLRTCNRLEIYGVGSGEELPLEVARRFCEGAGVEFVEEVWEVMEGVGAVERMMAVAAGLESQVVGETEIFGQVKGCYEEARGFGATGRVLNKVFQKVFQGAKWVRSHLGVGAGRVSLAGVAVDLAERIFGDLAGERVLLLGAGEIGERVAREVLGRGEVKLVVANRTGERALALAGELDAGVLPWERVGEHLREFSIVIGSTASPEAVVTREMVIGAMKRRPEEMLFFIDLAMPRDVEAGVGELENVFLYNLDDLGRIAGENLKAREAEVEKARRVVEERAERVWRGVAE